VLDFLQVGVADSAGFHADEDFTGADPRRRNVFHLNGALAR